VIYPTIDWVVKKIDWLADKYINALSRVLKMVPKFKDKSDDELNGVIVDGLETILNKTSTTVKCKLSYKDGELTGEKIK